jgi:hypothetical protein
LLKIDDNILPFSTYSALKAYLNIRPKFDGPLFCHLNLNWQERNFSQHYSHPYNFWDIILIELIHILLELEQPHIMPCLVLMRMKLKKRADGAPTHTNVILDYNSVLVYFRFTNSLDCWKLLDTKSGWTHKKPAYG